jgi:FkbM family methyltransferase
MTLHYPLNAGVGGGLGSLHVRRDASVPVIEYGEANVDTIRLDDYADTHDVASVDLLKMDIEGHELFALRGATRLLDT